MRTADRLSGWYFAAQAVVGMLLWVLYVVSPKARGWFGLVPRRPQVTESFFLPDLAMIAGSALTARALWAGRRSAAALAAFTAGGMLYPTLYLVQWVALTHVARVVLVMMLPAAVLSGALAVAVFVAADD